MIILSRFKVITAFFMTLKFYKLHVDSIRWNLADVHIKLTRSIQIALNYSYLIASSDYSRVKPEMDIFKSILSLSKLVNRSWSWYSLIFCKFIATFVWIQLVTIQSSNKKIMSPARFSSKFPVMYTRQVEIIE